MVISSISDAPIKVYWDNSLCEGPSGFLVDLSINVSSIGTNDCLTCNRKNNVKCESSTDYYPIQYCIGIENIHECGSGAENLLEDILVHLEAISESTYSYPAGCLEILQKNNLATSGTIRAPNGSLVSVYCDMEGRNCDGRGGWMRVGYLNMSEPNATCPPGLTLLQFANIDHGVCGQPMSSPTFYSAHGFGYTKVCGQIRGYQFRSPDGFPPLYYSNASPSIENCSTYVDGVTITYGSNPRKHLWTYGCGLSEAAGVEFNPPQYVCPCNSDSEGTYVPEWIGSDYYCESGLPSEQNHEEVLYSNDTLWDGKQCNGNEGLCCTNPKMPWFIKALNETTTDYIELRVCGSESSKNEDTPVDIIELYVQ